jgi:hypothetical protein
VAAPAPAEDYDVFVSYASPDEDAVQAIVDALRARGLSVWFSASSVDDFTSITKAIERGIAHARAMVVYYSAIYPQRRACQWELTTAYLAAQREGDPRERLLVVNPEPGVDHLEPHELRDALFRPGPE